MALMTNGTSLSNFSTANGWHKASTHSNSKLLICSETTPLISHQKSDHGAKENETTRFQFTTKHCRLLLTSITICLGGCIHYAFQVTALNPTEKVFQDFINSTHYRHYGTYLDDESYRILWSVILNLLYAGTIVGTLPVVKLSETFGRRKSFYFSLGFILAGLLCQSFAKAASAYELFALGRLLVGIGIGVTIPLQSMYFNEISPLELRGFIGSLSAIFAELGYILGGVLALPIVLGTQNNWSSIFLVEIAIAIILLPILPFMHESPRFLVSRQQLDAAKRSLEFFGHQNIKASIEEIQMDIASQKNEVKWTDLWKKPYLRRGVFLSLTLVFSLNLSGMVAVDYYSTKILSELGLRLETAQYASVGIFSGTLLASLFGGFFVERLGRRFLVLTGIFASIIINTALMIFSIIYQQYQAHWAGYASVAATCCLALAFGFGLSIPAFLLPAELMPLNARSRLQFLAMVTFNMLSGIIAFLFYPLQGLAGPYVFLLFIIPLSILALILFFKLPETMGKTPMEIIWELGYREYAINGVLNGRLVLQKENAVNKFDE